MSRKAQEGEKKAEAPSASLWEQISTIVFAVMIAFAIRLFVIEPFRIPSGSMLPTLLIGDHLFVNKFIYGIKIPLTDFRLPGIREPRRGDVIVFTVAKDGGETYPADRHPKLSTEEFVKRIVGLPGDRIEFRDGDVMLNGEAVSQIPSGDDFHDPMGRSLKISDVTMGEYEFQVLRDPLTRQRQPRPITVEPGRYFVLGDNRDYSKDSRFWGTVRLNEIKGPAFIIYWSWDFKDGWLQALNPVTWWTTEKRWDRIGDRVPLLLRGERRSRHTERLLCGTRLAGGAREGPSTDRPSFGSQRRGGRGRGPGRMARRGRYGRGATARTERLARHSCASGGHRPAGARHLLHGKKHRSHL